jgi:hypothetical protein
VQRLAERNTGRLMPPGAKSSEARVERGLERRGQRRRRSAARNTGRQRSTVRSHRRSERSEGWSSEDRIPPSRLKPCHLLPEARVERGLEREDSAGGAPQRETPGDRGARCEDRQGRLYLSVKALRSAKTPADKGARCEDRQGRQYLSVKPLRSAKHRATKEHGAKIDKGCFCDFNYCVRAAACTRPRRGATSGSGILGTDGHNLP